MAVPNWKDLPTQMELNSYVNGQRLMITWCVGNKWWRK